MRQSNDVAGQDAVRRSDGVAWTDQPSPSPATLRMPCSRVTHAKKRPLRQQEPACMATQAEAETFSFYFIFSSSEGFSSLCVSDYIPNLS